MDDRKFEITDARSGAAVSVRVVTRATETEVAGMTEEGILKIRLKASPAGDPSANQELIEFISQQLSVSPDKIEIVAGAASRDKILSIEGVNTQDVEEKLNPDS